MLSVALLGLLSPSGRRGRLLIFTYHRVLERPDPLLPDEPDAAEFAWQMDWIAEFCRVLPLSEAVQRLSTGTLPERAACITFDDGYANNHDVAMPILVRRGLTATVYVTVDAIERGVMWNDLVIEAHRQRNGTGNGSAAAAIAATLDELKYRPLEERWGAAAELYRQKTGAGPPRLMMTSDRVRAMARAGFEIGAHTVNHPILKRQSLEQARREIHGSRDWIADLLGAAPKSFAYPNGRPGRDYDQTHARLVQEAGFESAVSTHWNCARVGSDRFQLPRVTFWDRTPSRFWLRLARTYAGSYVRS
jgi:peptidoglycan/xylan/chitin deacetylase (PgdA/CDA1 family)